MARVRSPNYPICSLSEAIVKAKMIHDQEQHLSAPRDVLAKHIGYGGLNGASAKVLSALLKYGLLEETTDGKMKLSNLAISILFPKDREEKINAIEEAALKPQLFSELHTEYSGSIPSDENLRSYLVRKSFSKDALDKVIQSYKETIDFVDLESPNRNQQKNFEGDDKQKQNDEKSGDNKERSSLRENDRKTVNISNPLSVTFTGDKIEVSAHLTDLAEVEKLISVLNATKVLLSS